MEDNNISKKCLKSLKISKSKQKIKQNQKNVALYYFLNLRKTKSIFLVLWQHKSLNRAENDLVLVIVNSYLDGQTDDFESKGPGTNTLGYMLYVISQAGDRCGEKMCLRFCKVCPEAAGGGPYKSRHSGHSFSKYGQTKAGE